MGKVVTFGLMIALAATGIAAQTPSQVIAPAPRPSMTLTPLTAQGDALCLPDGGPCLTLDAPTETGDRPVADHPVLTVRARGAEEISTTITLPISRDETGEVQLWPYTQAGAETGAGAGRLWLIGFLVTERTMYSGGGGAATRLHLHQATIDAARMDLGREVLDLPITASLMIRACFEERDARRRRGACHDEYRYGATIGLADSVDGGALFPDLVYAAQATSYPQTARRWEDSSTAQPLTAADLSSWTDPECSYTRRLRYNPASERYEMDRPGPDCSSYTQP